MAAYATTAELAVKMRTTFDEADEAYAAMILDEIGAYLEQLVTVDATDTVQAANLKYASLSMASRAMESAHASDIASTTLTAGVYTETTTYAQPYATNNWWKLLKASGYASRLGVSNGIGFAHPSFGILDGDDDEGN
jgi:hypothetical protein